MELQWDLPWVQLYQMPFFVFMNQKGLKNALLNSNKFFTVVFFDGGIFVLFKSTNHNEKFCNYFNTCHPNTVKCFI